MPKRYFVSHSSYDKPRAVELKEQLSGDAWVDLYEIELGDLLLEAISQGIESASDFVLLWSEHSAESQWVKFELHMAFILWLEDKSVTIRVVCLDSTPLPLYLRPFLQAKQGISTEALISALTGAIPPPSPRRKFCNRNSEIDRIETALHDPATAAIFICGVPGSGKRALAREALSRLTSGGGTVQRITVNAGVAEPELNLLVAGALKALPAVEGLDISGTVAHTNALLGQHVNSGGIWLFEDAEHWLNDDGSLGRMSTQVLGAVQNPDGYAGRLVVFTSRRRPHDSSPAFAISSFHLSGLSKNFAVPLLVGHGAAGSPEELSRIAEELDGHPLASEVVAPRLPLNPADLREQRYSIATDLVSPTSISSNAWRMLEVLALADGPFRGEDMAEFLSLSADALTDAITISTEYSLVTYEATGSLSLHPLLRDYFLRSFRKQPDHSVQTGVLADLMSARLATLSPGQDLYVPSLLSTVKILGLAGRFEEARGLRQGLIGTLHSTAIELYQEKRYDEALRYVDEAITGSHDIDEEVLQLKVKTLAYLGRLNEARSLSDDLIRLNPTSPSVLRGRGRVEFIAREWKTSIVYFERAIPLRRNPAQLWSDIAQARIRLEDWTGAVAAARIAIDRGGDTPWTLSLYSEALERLGELNEAETVMQRAVVREPTNPAYRHRLGRIAQETSNRELAIEQFRKCVELDPNFVQSWLSLASSLADERDFEGAQRALDSGNSIPGAPRGVVNNVRAKSYMLTGDLDAAHTAIESALNVHRDVQNIALSIRVWIARAEAGSVPKGQAQAQVSALARELDTNGGLCHVFDSSRDFPSYFER